MKMFYHLWEFCFYIVSWILRWCCRLKPNLSKQCLHFSQLSSYFLRLISWNTPPVTWISRCVFCFMDKQWEKFKNGSFAATFLWWCMGQKTLLLIWNLSLAESRIFGVIHQIPDHVSNRNTKVSPWKVTFTHHSKWPWIAAILCQMSFTWVSVSILRKSISVKITWGPGLSRAGPPARLLCCWGQHLWHVFLSAWRMQLCRSVQCTLAGFF